MAKLPERPPIQSSASLIQIALDVAGILTAIPVGTANDTDTVAAQIARTFKTVYEVLPDSFDRWAVFPSALTVAARVVSERLRSGKCEQADAVREMMRLANEIAQRISEDAGWGETLNEHQRSPLSS